MISKQKISPQNPQKKKTQIEHETVHKLLAKNEDRPIQDIPPKKLDQLVGEFIVCVRKEKPDERGSYEYEPSYLRGIIASIERYLKEYNYPCSLTRDKQFTYTQSMLAAKQRDLKKQGKGNKPCKSDHLLPTEVEKMWQTGALGTQNPQSLQYTLWWYLMTEAGMRASREHLFLCWGGRQRTERDTLNTWRGKPKCVWVKVRRPSKRLQKYSKTQVIHPDAPFRLT